jgi:hypothetical protein
MRAVPASAAPSPVAPPVPVAAAARRGARIEGTLLMLVIAAQLLPLVLLPFVPTQDGPSHQALAYALRVWERPEGAPLREVLEHNDEALPNWFVFFLQAKALAFLSTQAAEKVLIAAYVVLLPLGLRYALRAVDRQAGFLAVLAPSLTYNFAFAMGFLNFCWSLAAFCFGLGFYLRHRERFAARHGVALAVLATWVYFCHAVTLVMLLLAVGTLGCCWAVAEARGRGGTGRAFLRALATRLLVPLAAFLPALVLLAVFLGRRLARPTSRLPFPVLAKHLAALYSLVSFDRRLLAGSVVLALLLATLAAWLLRRRLRERALSPWDALLAVAALFVLVYFLAPSELAGGGFVNHRLALFPPLVLVLWLGSGEWGPRARRIVASLGAALALGMLGLLWLRWAAVDRQLAEYVAAVERVEDGRSVLPLGFAPAGVAADGRQLAFRLWPFVHAVGYVAGHRPIVDLGLYEAGEDYFPLRYRPDRDPYRWLSQGPVGVEEVPPRVDLARYERVGGRVDYVLLWEPRAAPSDHPGTRELYRQLEAGFERVFVSATGSAELWGRRGAER